MFYGITPAVEHYLTTKLQLQVTEKHEKQTPNFPKLRVLFDDATQLEFPFLSADNSNKCSVSIKWKFITHDTFRARDGSGAKDG